MISDIFFNISFSVIDWLLSLFPASSGFPSDVHTAAAGLGGYVGIWTPILPMETLITCIGIVFGVEMAVFGFKTVKWIISHIPVIGGKGI